MTVRSISSLIFMLLLPAYYKKLSYRIGVLLAGLIGALAFLIYGFAKGLFAYRLGATLAGACYTLAGIVPVTVMISRWFSTHKALAIGIAAAGSGLATTFTPPLVYMLIANYTLPSAFRIEAVFALLLVAAASMLIFNDPAPYGMLPYGSGEQDNTKKQPAARVTSRQKP